MVKLTGLKTAKDDVTDFRKIGNTAFDQIQTINTEIVQFTKGLVEEVTRRQANTTSSGSAPIQPVAQQSSRVAMSSMYGAKVSVPRNTSS
jgi:hypothetical protein